MKDQTVVQTHTHQRQVFRCLGFILDGTKDVIGKSIQTQLVNHTKRQDDGRMERRRFSNVKPHKKSDEHTDDVHTAQHTTKKIEQACENTQQAKKRHGQSCVSRRFNSSFGCFVCVFFGVLFFSLKMLDEIVIHRTKKARKSIYN